MFIGASLISQYANIFSVLYPRVARFGKQAYWIMGGGPHMTISTSSAAGGRCSLIMSQLTNPEL